MNLRKIVWNLRMHALTACKFIHLHCNGSIFWLLLPPLMSYSTYGHIWEQWEQRAYVFTVLITTLKVCKVAKKIVSLAIVYERTLDEAILQLQSLVSIASGKHNDKTSRSAWKRPSNRKAKKGPWRWSEPNCAYQCQAGVFSSRI